MLDKLASTRQARAPVRLRCLMPFRRPAPAGCRFSVLVATGKTAQYVEMERLLTETSFVRKLVITVLCFSHLMVLVKEMRSEAGHHHTLSRHKTLTGARRPPRAKLLAKRNNTLAIVGKYKYNPANQRLTQMIAEKSAHNITLRLPNTDKFKKFSEFSIIVYSFLILKYVIFIALESKILEHYRYLSCYMIGRIMLNGRVTKLANYVSLMALLFLVSWRTVMLKIKPKFRFDCLEFLLHDHDELLVLEAKHQPSERCARSKSSADLDSDSILRFKNQFAHRSTRVLFRPNRTCKTWLALARQLMVSVFTSTVCLLLTTVVAAIMLLPMSLTRRGFELSYQQCVEWIASQPDESAYSHIYVPSTNSTAILLPEPVVFLPLEDFCQFNFYHLLRVSLDLIENLVIYLDVVAAFSANTTLAVMISADVRHYSYQISIRLKQAIAQNKSHTLYELSKSNSRIWVDDSKLTDLQATIIDNFHSVQFYDRFVSFYVTFCVSVWIVYSVLVSSWMLAPVRFADTAKFEWYFVHAVSTVYVLVIIGSFAQVRIACKNLYPLISTVAALDGDHFDRKNRWLTIMKHYNPKPLYCFTMFKSSEVSWMFLFKLFAWMFSALLVASNFFIVYDAHQLHH